MFVDHSPDRERGGPLGRQGRWPCLDALRGLALLSMTAYHGLYDYYVLYGAQPGWPALAAVSLWQRLGAGLFFFLSGFCFSLGYRRWQGGLQLCLWGAVISAATYFFLPEQLILYGVLTFLGLAPLLTLALAPFLRRLPPLAGLLLCLLGYQLTGSLDGGWAALGGWRLWQWPAFLYQDCWAVLGFHSPGFSSADYVPLLPNIFTYYLGYFAYQASSSPGRPGWAAWLDLAPLTFLGRHSLLVYLVHQPLLLGLAYLLWG